MYDFLIFVGFNVYNDMINCNKKMIFYKIFLKNLEWIVEVKVYFFILGMLVRKLLRLKKNYLEVNNKI